MILCRYLFSPASHPFSCLPLPRVLRLLCNALCRQFLYLFSVNHYDIRPLSSLSTSLSHVRFRCDSPSNTRIPCLLRPPIFIVYSKCMSAIAYHFLTSPILFLTDVVLFPFSTHCSIVPPLAFFHNPHHHSSGLRCI